MKCGIILEQKNKLWVIKAIDRVKKRTIAEVLGKRDTKIFRRLYDKVKYLIKCAFYTNIWNIFAKILPSERHVIGKAHTYAIELDNISTRHYLARFTRCQSSF